MFNSYEELQAAVEKRRNDTLILEIDLGSEFSPEYEDAKKELAKAEALRSLAGEQQFLNDNVAALEVRVAELKPESKPVWVQYRRLDLIAWAALVKTQGLTPIDQYEKCLEKTFVGVFGDEDVTVMLSDDKRLMSTKGDLGILPGGAMQSVVNSFMSWQNSGGDVTIRPTKSGRV